MDAQESGSTQSWLIVNGVKYFAYKHWSYDGNFHLYKDETIQGGSLGEIVKGEWFPHFENGEPVIDRHNLRQQNNALITAIIYEG